MSDTSNFGFGKFVPGFDFLQSLAKGASSSIPQLPNLSNWVAPTISVEELEKRIDELKAVQFWLEQNSRALTATVQALEVQKMTLATLKGMNFSMGDVASAFKLKPADGVMGSMQKAAETFAGRAAATAAATPAPAAAAPAPAEPVKPAQAAPADDSKGSQAPEPTVVDPMHWWGALTSQFQQIAANALKDAAKQTSIDPTHNVATAKDLNADCMATGHYIQRKMGAAGAELHSAADPRRDQSYFLFSTTPEQLDYLRFPLGHLASKAETRALAAKYGLPVADKPDSQDICFVPNGNYAAVIEKLRPEAADPGDIVDMAGNVLGQHRGVIHYTIGQRKGLGIGGLEEPIYVVKLDPATRQVVVGPKEALSTRLVPVREINWLGDAPLSSRAEWHLNVKVRSTRPPLPAVIRPISETEAEVELFTPEDGVSPGQACVFYDPESSRIFGGGWIWKGR